MDQREHQKRALKLRRRQSRRLLWAWLRERLLLVSGIAVVLLLMSAGLGYNYVSAQVFDDVCRPISEVDLSLTQMAKINTRAQEYQADPGRNAHLVLASEESSFMLAQFVDFDVKTRAERGLMEIEAAVPRGSGCVRVHAVGNLTVTNQVATFVPLELKLGDLDVTGLGVPVGAVVFQVSDIEGDYPLLAEQLANMDGLAVVEDTVEVRLIDRYKLF